MEKKISVVIPTYRRPALLRKCLISLSKQDMDTSQYEIIVVSDGPDEDTRTMLNGLTNVSLPFMQYVTLARNSGPACARNTGWKKAHGTLIAFTDDDCRPGPSWLSSLWRAYEQSGFAANIAFSGKVVVPLPEHPTDFELNTSHLETADFVTANCACTKTALQHVGGFDERFRVAWREDSDLEFKLLEKNFPVRKVNSAIVVHPVRKARWGISIAEQRKTMFNALLYKKYPSLFRKKIQRSPAYNYYLIVIGYLLIMAGLILQMKSIAVAGALLCIVLTAAFIIRRLVKTSRSYSHVMEMIATSFVIPIASVYWTLYGAFKYRVLYY
jgi:glycosyltransferase involved in cell wall biosynthesis